jgi:surface polysaccharide O-acyltransferase-like enzyme
MVKRDNGLDFLRIICMLLVTFSHVFTHGGLINDRLLPGMANWFLGNLLYPFTLVAVNCFVLLSGYFQCTSRFKLKRVVSTWVQVVVYSVGMYIAAKLLFGGFSVSTLLKSALPVVTDQYWFITAYLLMYMVSPFLNCMIRAMGKRLHFLCCCTLLGIFSVAHNLTYIYDFGDVDGGYTFLWFCILYTIAAYIRLYVPVEGKHRKWGLLTYALCALGVGLARFVAHYATTWLLGVPMLTSFFYSYNSILVVPASIGLFMAMRTVKVEGRGAKLVSIFAPLAFGVYLIHDHPHLRPFLWEWLKPGAMAQSVWMLPYCLLCIVGIFAVCCGIEWLRQRIFHLCRIDRAISTVSDRIQGWVAAKVEKLPLD